MKKKITIEIEIPNTCGECLFYSEQPYRCHNERGMEAYCSKGYMDNDDMRDSSFINSKWKHCKLGE